LLIIDVDDLDFVKNKKDLQTITDKIDESLKGL
jgi:deoxyadenosine/deoxycytidine kinase